MGKSVLAAFAVQMLMAGCIREKLPDCPPLELTVTVKDKNYFNIDDAVKPGLMERKDEGLPFREFVGTLYYIVTNDKGEVVAMQKNTPVDNDLAVQTITLPASLPYGTYTATVWGNMQSEEPLGEDATTAEMEAVGAAANDIYLASATVEYKYGNEHHTLNMERAKGNLLIKAEGIPDNIDFSTKNISDIYGRVDADFSYDKLTDIHTELDWQVKNEIKSETLMCPSPSFEGSTLAVRFIDKSTETAQYNNRAVKTVLEPEDVNITMGRNEITILKYIYTADEEDFSIYVWVNDEWEMLHQLEVE